MALLHDPDSPAGAGGEFTILVVDDDPDVCSLVSCILETSGFKVVSTTSPRQAMDIALTNGDVGLLLTDIQMPEIRGDELARWLNVQRPQVPVVLMSGCFSGDQFSTYHFIPKPFPPPVAFVGTIQQALVAARSSAKE